jgi:hypothetical protein
VAKHVVPADCGGSGRNFDLDPYTSAPSLRNTAFSVCIQPRIYGAVPPLSTSSCTFSKPSPQLEIEPTHDQDPDSSDGFVPVVYFEFFAVEEGLLEAVGLEKPVENGLVEEAAGRRGFDVDFPEIFEDNPVSLNKDGRVFEQSFCGGLAC